MRNFPWQTNDVLKQVAGLAFGVHSEVRKKHYRQKTNWKTNIKDGQNGTKIGASDIFEG